MICVYDLMDPVLEVHVNKMGLLWKLFIKKTQKKPKRADPTPFPTRIPTL